MNVEMVMGHSLQHIEKLYQTQSSAKANHYKLQGKIDTLESTVKTLQNKVNRLTTQLEKLKPNQEKSPQKGVETL